MFDALPQDGQVAELPQSCLLRWPALPQQTAESTSAPLAAICSGGRDMIENPPVNPILGLDRSADDVRRDTQAHYDAVRRERASSSFQPIFHGDYLFVKSESPDATKGVELVQVCLDPDWDALCTQ